MTIYIDDHPFHYEMENLVRLFFPNEKLITISEIPDQPETPYILTSMKINQQTATAYISADVHIGEFQRFSDTELDIGTEDFEKTAERAMAVCLYRLLCQYSGKEQPWGILTGVRPIKLFRRLAEKKGEEYAKNYFRNELLVSKEKTELSALTEQYERKILSLSQPMSFSLYVSIPFCPTRCSYCSFVSQTVEKTKKLVQPYFELLCKELEYTAAIAKEKGLKLESVYVGGGTPTTLSAEQLSALIKTIQSNFDMSSCREFTIEAGRPDTINAEKLYAIYNGGIDRISINPQTLNDNVLEVIGRKHTAQQTLDAYRLAEQIGFKHINMDIIAGLPTEKTESFINTVDRLCELDPASITVHTLALKRSSRLTLNGKGVSTDHGSFAAEMLAYCEEKLTQYGYHPYYLYRQTRMEGNLENVGWSKKGFDGIYNVFVMDETHTILGCGAGAVTKLKVPGSEELTRIFNYKYPYEYINGFDEMLKRKEQVRTFYDELS
ncbi:MAG: coproporphyrinogen dehydrogenase HemZ [Clostridia bacterium]|nr:coproporphyrinogen dehydrogenase HemZ [Clostridia bacterium]